MLGNVYKNSGTRPESDLSERPDNPSAGNALGQIFILFISNQSELLHMERQKDMVKLISISVAFNC
jgi:hypothetical protein